MTSPATKEPGFSQALFAFLISHTFPTYITHISHTGRSPGRRSGPSPGPACGFGCLSQRRAYFLERPTPFEEEAHGALFSWERCPPPKPPSPAQLVPCHPRPRKPTKPPEPPHRAQGKPQCPSPYSALIKTRPASAQAKRQCLPHIHASRKRSTRRTVGTR